ncbi:hypothetical protein [Mobiluncus sp.]|uniref:hypothetical protein n=1 Tax=Mobiluncus sp. TaxID=47293 RepID=UPI002A91FFEE|nr:hypothetical protein [Mobiluncus sp.]MDY6076582.1 hypothetical protein [Mobiluncus sp.]
MKYKRPIIKKTQPVYRITPSTFRIGAQLGTTAEFTDRKGEMWNLIKNLDGRTVDEVVSSVRMSFPGLSRDDVLDGLRVLDKYGFLDDVASEVGVPSRYLPNVRYFSASGNILRSTFRTNLNHIWMWSSPARFVAICSGLVIDISIAALLILILPDSSPWLSSALSTIIFRIFWEFNITRKTDARWILCLAFDNPLLMITLKKGKLALVVHLLGIAYDVTLFLLWPLLFALSSIGLLI